MTPKERMQRLDEVFESFLAESRGDGGWLRIGRCYFCDCTAEDWEESGRKVKKDELFNLRSPIDSRQREGLIQVIGPEFIVEVEFVDDPDVLEMNVRDAA